MTKKTSKKELSQKDLDMIMAIIPETANYAIIQTLKIEIYQLEQRIKKLELDKSNTTKSKAFLGSETSSEQKLNEEEK